MMSEIAGFPAQSMTWIMVVAGLGMFFGNLTSGYVGDRTNPALTSAVIEALSILTMIMLFFFSSIQWAAVVLTFIATAGLFGLGGPLQSLIIKYSKGGEMLGAASIQVAFNVGNAVAAFIGGSIISASLPVNYTALCAIPLLVLGSLCVFILYRRFERNNE